jgi:uncharacterized protein
MSVFLSAEWRKLIMANYIIDPCVLNRFLPAHTALDTWENQYYVSLVGFMFEKVRLKRIAIPFHTLFPEVNLRFYVKHFDGVQWKRGVVFISEIVPKHAIAWVANSIFRENYSVCPMMSGCQLLGESIHVNYQWKRKSWNKLSVIADSTTSLLQKNSRDEFITEHFWGYAKCDDHSAVEYHVEHPRWDLYKVKETQIECDFGGLYGKEFGFLATAKPDSVFLAEGSGVKIYGRRVISDNAGRGAE